MPIGPNWDKCHEVPAEFWQPRFRPRLMKRFYNSSRGVFIDYKYTVQLLVKVEVKSFHGSRQGHFITN